MEIGGGSGGGGGGDDVHGLMFGQRIYFEQEAAAGAGSGQAAGAGSGGRRGSRGAAASGGSSSGAASSAATPPRCQVEGCGVDLSGIKTYYCRHKVCLNHAKAPRVVVAGIEQRFCQQCSRFHQLPEFDQGKRSCRRRLAGHNERRRRPPPGPLASRLGRFASSFQEPGRFRSFLLDFSFPGASAGSPAGSAGDNGWPAGAGDRMAAGAMQWQQQQGNHQLLHPHRGAVAGYGDPASYMGAPGPGGSVAGGAPMAPPALEEQLPVARVATDFCALSLLSTQQPWDHHTTTSQSGSHQHHQRSAAMSAAFDGAPVSPSVMASSYAAASSWSGGSSSRVHDAGGASRGLQHRLPPQEEDGLHMVHSTPAGSVHHGHFSGELELALQGSGPTNPPHHGDQGPSSSFGGHASNAMDWSL